MSDARATIALLNGISLNAIDQCEKMLRSLPKKGTRCEMNVCKPLPEESGPRGTGDVVASKSMKIRDEPRPLTLSPKKKKVEKSDSSSSSKSTSAKNKKRVMKPKVIVDPTSDESSRKKKKNVESPPRESSKLCSKSSSSIECKVLTDQVRVQPILTCAGVILEVDVEVTVPSGDVKKMKLAIECPDFKPRRIKFGGKWKEIV